MKDFQEKSYSETKVAIHTLGCKANQYDSSFMESLLRSRNFSLVDFKEKADIYIINTCTVTDSADLDSRNLIRRAQRRNPEAFKIVTGCYAQTKPEEVAEIEGVDLVLGNGQKAKLLEYLEQARPEKARIEADNIFLQTKLETFGMTSYSKNARAFVKIQDGCNQFCSFCIIPYARGQNRSISIPRVLEELRNLSESGFHEAVLTGIHIGTYGHDQNPPTNLVELLKAIEIERPIHRVRVSSVDPEEISDEMIEVMTGSSTLCPHMHIPLQSGDDATLKMMKRRYDRKKFFEVCDKLSAKASNFCIGTDVIVGFPYEDESRFQNTYDLLQDSAVHYFHVFPFSPKRGTKAANMLGQVSHQTKKERAQRLRELSEKKSKEFRNKAIGEEVEVILESWDDSAWMGHSENYLPVVIRTPTGSHGQMLRCRLQSESGGMLVGKSL